MKRNLEITLCLFIGCMIANGPSAAPAKDQGEGQAAIDGHGSPHATMQHRRGPRSVVLNIDDDAKATLWKPDLSTVPIRVVGRKVTLPSTGMDNYHALVASRHNGRKTEVAIRYEYLRGKPSGHSPRELLAATKSALEIVPDPIPREHYHYFSGQTWDFIVRFRGKPLPGTEIHLKTSNGSRLKAVSDDEGRVSLRLPDDFQDAREGIRDRRSAEFELLVSHEENGHEYQTILNADYRVNPKLWRSHGLGIVVTGAGLLIGGLIGRLGVRNNERPRRHG